MQIHPKKIASARLYATARGSYRVKVNGIDADGSFFAPGFTDYRLRIFYQTYDVTNLLHEGENQLFGYRWQGLLQWLLRLQRSYENMASKNSFYGDA